MPNLDEYKRRYQLLIQQLNIIVFYESDLGLSQKETERAIDIILDEMIEIRQFLKQNSPADDDLAR